MRLTRPWPFLIAALLPLACGDEDDDIVITVPEPTSIVDAVLTTPEDTPVAGTLTVEGSGVTSVLVEEPPAHGTLTLTLGTQFVYTPAPDYVGSDRAVLLIRAQGAELRGSVTITVTPVNDPPRVAGVLIVEEDGLVRVTTETLTVTDPDSDASSLALTLLPGGLTYSASGDILRPPPNFVGELTAFLRVTDGAASANTTVKVTVTPVNDAPANVVPIPQRTPVDTPFTFSGSVAVSDIDASNAPVSMTLTASAGTFSLASLDGLALQAGTGTDDVAVSVTGELAALNRALDGLAVTPPPAFTGIIILSLRTDDQGATGAGGARVDDDTFLLGVGSVDLPPFNTVPGSAECDEDGVLVFDAETPLEISTIDIDLGPADIIEVTLEATSGVLDLAGLAGLTLSSGSGTGDATMTFAGTLAAVNAALDGVRFTPSANYVGGASVRLLTTSNALSDDDTVAVTVRAVNDAPAISGPASPLAIPNNAPYTLSGVEAVTVTDIDAAMGLVRLTVAATNGSVSLGPTPDVTVVSSSVDQIVAEGTLTAINTALAGIAFVPTSGFVGNGTMTVTVNDNGNTGAGGAAFDSLLISFSVFAPNSPPSAVADTYASRGNTLLTVEAASGLLANDSDSDGTIAGTTAGTVSSTLGGTVVIAVDGSFTYQPPVGVGNATTPVADGFTYTVFDDDGASSVGLVTVNLGQVIWYVESTQDGDGSSGSPFGLLQDALTRSTAGAIIYVSGGPYSGSFAVPAGVELVGSGVALDRGPNGTLTAGTAPTINGTGVAVLSLGSGSAVRGVRIAPPTDPGYPGILVDGSGGVTISNVEVRKHAPAIAVKNNPSAVTISASLLADTAGDAMSLLRDTAGTSNISVSDVRLESTRLGNGILARAQDGGALDIVADNLRTRGIDTNGVDAAAIGSGSLVNLAIADGDFANDTVTALGDTAIRVVASGSGATVSFDIAQNAVDAWPGAAISVEAADPGASISGQIRDNVVVATVPLAFQAAAVSVLVDAPSVAGVGSGSVVVTGNTVTVGADGGPGLAIASRDGAAHVLDVRVSGNTLDVDGVAAQAFAFTGSAGADLCLELSTNVASSADVAYAVASGGPTMTLPGLTGSPLTFIASNNTGTPVTFSGAAADGPACAVP